MPIDQFVSEQLHAFLREDLGPGDVTTGNLSGLRQRPLSVELRSREEGVLAGLEFALAIFTLLDPDLSDISIVKPDGAALVPGDLIASFTGKATAILQGERTALNLLQRLSGIASLTRRFVTALQGSPTQLLDTRKTTPGFRYFEKYAVRIGGGHNHRFGLFDGAMLKDNHIAAAGGIRPAVDDLRSRVPVTIRIEIETDTLEQVEEALAAGADIIMLDNMDADTIRRAVTLIAGRAKVEASGRIRLEDLPTLAHLGLDYISTSALVTRSHWLDIGLDISHG